MSANSFGKKIVLTTFGESHGDAIGGILDGFPSNIPLDLNEIQLALDRRKPGQSSIVTQRKEPDTVEFFSGIFNGMSTGTPIGFIIKNTNAKSKDYDHLKENFRPGHADYTYKVKYGNRDYRGGGRSSARETASRVVGGAICSQWLKMNGIEVAAWVSSVGKLHFAEPLTAENKENRWNNIVRTLSNTDANLAENYIKEVRKAGNTIGGLVSCRVTGLPVGLGEPVFDKLHARLAYAIMGINAVKGFEYGAGFDSAEMLGTEYNDIYYTNEQGEIKTKTNRAGGIQGGISNGMDIYFKTAFRAVSTIMQTQETVDVTGAKTNVEGKGRHDPCVVPRAVPIVEAMTALVIADFLALR
ncbi:MAG: chorismate synthase [Luteibaculaceae bacterium]